MNGLDGVIAAAADVQAFCQRRGWSFCFIGGVAVQRWGMPRFTQDVDAILFAGIGSEALFIDDLLQEYSGRRPEARQFALEHRVVLARNAAGIDLDFSLGALPFEERCIARATTWKVNETTSLITCSAEDLVIHKVFAARDRDWSDVESVLARQHDRLDISLIREELPPLLELKDDMDPLKKLEQMIERFDLRNKP